MSEITSPPVKEGEEYNLTVESEGSKGDGITRINGYVIFIPQGIVEKKYRVRITKASERFGFAKILEEL